MKCCHYERCLTDISGTFYGDQFILSKVQLFLLSFLSTEDEPPPPGSTPWGAYRPTTSCGTVPPSICLQSHAFTHFTHSHLVGRSMVVGYILTVYTCSVMCTNHIDMTAHTLAFLPSWVPLIYMWSTPQLGIVSCHIFGAMQIGWSPMHVLTVVMIA